jgi:peptidoglycan L-alanyl-D-glutamate endopeptidase CwlK
MTTTPSVLKLGSEGPEVKALQQRLREEGFSPGVMDGQFGPGTQAAVMAFQRSRKMLPDGVAGPRTQAALQLVDRADLPSATAGMTEDIASRMCPFTPLKNIHANLPFVLQALDDQKIGHRPIVLMAVATIRAETESFLPISEGISRFNTSPGGEPFDLYDRRTDLGNRGKGDGARFRGRGFVQLTGRANYEHFGALLKLPLVETPELANASSVAAALLALFLKSRELKIKEALLHEDLRTARRLVNGGSHGLEPFSQAYRTGDALLPP